MTESQHCPRCGRELPADAPSGLCPPCLLGAALSSPGDDVPSAAGSTAADSLRPEHRPGTIGGETVALDSRESRREESPAPQTTVRYFGDYEIQAEIGHGGMGVVYRARQVSLNRPVALKLIRAGVLAGDDELRRFQNEAEAVALLDHPGIVPVYEVGEHDGQRYFSMKLVAGGNLADRRASYRDDPRAAAALLGEAAAAVHHAHVRGGLHTLTKVKERSPESPRKLNAKLPRDLEVICLKCLEKDPRRRYSSAQALADDLWTWLDGRPIAARPVSTLERMALFVRRRPALAAAYGLTAAVLVLAGFGGSLAWLWRRAESARAEAVVARDDARRARSGAEKARDAEREARAEAEREREKSERIEYGRTMQVAHQEWRGNNVGATLVLLENTRPDLRGWEWRYVHRLCHSDLLTLKGPATTERVRAASVGSSSDGPSTAKTNPSTTIGGTVVNLPAFSPDATRIVTEGMDGEARVWDARTGAEVLTLNGHTAQLYSASFSPDGSRIVTGSRDRTAKVWDARTGAEVFTLKGHTNVVHSAWFSPDRSWIVTASYDGTARVWDAAAGTEMFTLELDRNRDPGYASRLKYVRGESAALSPDALRIITKYVDFVKMWNPMTGAQMFPLPGEGSRVTPVSFSPDGSRIVTAGPGGGKLLQARTGLPLLTLPGASWFNSASFSPDGSRIVTASDDQTAQVWNAATGAEILTLRGHTGRVTFASFSRDGSRILTADENQTVKVWDARTPAEPLTHITGQPISFASFNPDGSRIVSTTLGGGETAQVWDAATGNDLVRLTGHFFRVLAAQFSPDGRRVVTGSRDRTAKVWDARTGDEVLTLRGHKGDVRSVSFSSDGSRIVTTSLGRNTARVWNARTGAELLTLKGHTAQVDSASFSPDGSRIVTASFDQTAKVWDARVGCEVLTLKGQIGALQAASFSPDGLRIVTMGFTGTEVWETRPVTPPKEGGNQAADDPSTASPGLPASVVSLLSELRKAGKGSLADELVREIDQARESVARDQKSSPGAAGHVIVGRVVGEGLDDASQVVAEMAIHREGYFVGLVGAYRSPVGFRKQGYLPVEITPRGGHGVVVEDVGEIHLRPVPAAMRAAVKAKLILEGATGAAGATARLITQPGPSNRLLSETRAITPPESTSIPVAASGDFFAPDLSPMAYTISFRAPGTVTQNRPVILKPGQTLDLGTVRLERDRRIAVSYHERLITRRVIP